MMPIAELATTMPRKRPSAGSPAISSTTKNETRIRLNSVSVFSRTMPLTVRLEGSGSRSPRRASRCLRLGLGQAAAVARLPRLAHEGQCSVRTMTDTRPLVGVIMGSRSDWETMRHACETLDRLEVPHERRVVSAHRTPDLLFDYAHSARDRGLEVIIAGAGGAAHLPGMTAAKTSLPVLGVPIQSSALSGMDSLLSIVQMPAGIPVGTLAIGRAGAVNAALLATAIVAGSRPDVLERLERFRREQAPRRPAVARPVVGVTHPRHPGRRPARPHAGAGRAPAGHLLHLPRPGAGCLRGARQPT